MSPELAQLIGELVAKRVAEEVASRVAEAMADIENRLTKTFDAQDVRLSNLDATTTYLTAAVNKPGVPPQPAAAPPHKSNLKPAAPPFFNGDRTQGRAFLNACLLAHRTMPEDFPTDERKIGWTLSYMREGRANHFAQRAIAAFGRRQAYQWADWPAFETVFRQEFFPVDEETQALLTLEGTGYFQGKRSMDDYIDMFEELVDRANMTDEQSRILKFRRGLDSKLEEKIYTSQHPPKTFKDWKEDARRYAMAHIQAAQFRNAQQHPSAPVPPRLPAIAIGKRSLFAETSRQPLLDLPKPPVSVTRAPPPPPSKSLPPGVPMDIDAARKLAKSVATCRRCGEPGHFIRDCPRTFDIREMSMDEVQELLAHLQDTQEVEQAHAEAEKEDFTPTSG